MSALNIFGLSILIIGSFLQEFAIYRRTVSRTQRKCNDSKATLLLYYSTGVSCEIIGLFVVSFYTYLVSSNDYVVSFHILSYIYLTYKIPPTTTSKVSCGLFFLSFM